MKNYLFSTTRQWNPGDEFALHGTLRVLRAVESEFNPVIFNRNPEIKHREDAERQFQFNPRNLRVKRLKPGFYDNAFKRELAAFSFIDLVVFAGTLEWASSRMKVLYDYIECYDIPTIYLGIGAGEEHFDAGTLDERYRQVIRASKLIVVRDQIALKALKNDNALYLPCPALISAGEVLEKEVHTVRKIGLIYMTTTGVRSNHIDHCMKDFLTSLYREILQRFKGCFEFEFVCHYVDELARFSRDFPGETCRYSYDAEDYAQIYRRFDCVIGPRVHGIGMAASMGIPGIHIAHDVRGSACEGFLAETINPDQGVDSAVKIFASSVERFVSGKKSRMILRAKHKAFEEYVEKVGRALKRMD